MDQDFVPQKDPVPKRPLSSAKTFERDVRDTIEDNNISTFKIREAERKRMVDRGVDLSSKSVAKNKTMTLLIILGLLIVAALVVFILLSFGSDTDMPEPTSTPPVTEGLELNIASKPVAEITANAAASFVRSIEPEFGLGSLDEQSFVILRVRSFARAYPGMLAWEEVMMADLKSALSLPDVESEIFRDLIVADVDTRIISSDGNTVLVYGIIDKKTIIIATSQEMFKTLVEDHISTLR